ncbi:MAG: 50S ribosomal protein L23 [Chloroflexota bacterium]|nr:50S ribosomal protein L23 [Chloroflexota bacterium]
MDLYRVLERPIITEKSTELAQAQPTKPKMTNPDVHRYTFQVALKATKPEIKKAVEERYSVHVIAVNTMVMKPKEKGVGARRGFASAWKKAVVTLEHGQQIEDFFGTV